MFIELKKPVAVRCADGQWVTIPSGTKANYGSKRNGVNMIHTIHVYVRRVHNKIVNHETVTYSIVTPAPDIPEWL